MKKKKWARKYNECVICGTNKKKHHSKGMCKYCYTKKWQKENPEECRKYSKKYREENLEKTKESQKKYREKNKEKAKESNKKYREENSEKISKKQKKYREKNSEKISKTTKLWKERNIIRIKEYTKIYLFNKRNNNSHFKLRCNVSHSINVRLKSRLLSKNSKSTWEFLPYTVDKLKQHLEKLFQPGMNWDNYGYCGWHIDHKKPDSLFNYNSVEDEEFQKCWALENLQPLWAMDNFKKSNKLR